jgi:hypothetical protein
MGAILFYLSTSRTAFLHHEGRAQTTAAAPLFKETGQGVLALPSAMCQVTNTVDVALR